MCYSKSITSDSGDSRRPGTAFLVNNSVHVKWFSYSKHDQDEATFSPLAVPPQLVREFSMLLAQRMLLYSLVAEN